MPRFSYKARDKSGEDVVGMKDANDRYDLARQLRAGGYLLISADEVTATGEKKKIRFKIPAFLTNIFRHVALTEKIIFSKNLGVMISAGMPLTRALDALSRESRNKRFKEVIGNVVDDIRQGKTLTESLSTVASQMQADHDLLRKVRGAAVYPAIVLVAMIGIGIFMMIYVVPTLTNVFKELKV